jgi:hypothetical protein
LTSAEFTAAVEIALERLMLSLQGFPQERLLDPMAEGECSVASLLSELSGKAERVVRALEIAYRGEEVSIEALEEPSSFRHDLKRAESHLKLAHSTVMAAIERITWPVNGDEDEIPAWLIDHYLTPIELLVPKIESWANNLRSRGLAGPTGLPVIQ